ncbi:hypothetical protein DMV52_10330 [Salmonella enterica]|nr:hypothetical protein [Salmonella enterica]EAS2604970.1 hypothetical protein [Salmonella enterica]
MRFIGQKIASKNMKDAIIQHILKYIDDNCAENIRIDDLVAMTGYTPRHIQNIFQSVSGMPLGKYIRSRRLRRTAIRLKLTSQSVTDIGIEAGFDSAQSFSREFKKMFGVSPQAYRKMDSWNADKFALPFTLQNGLQPNFAVCELPDEILYGFSVSYQKSITRLPVFPNILRWKSVVYSLEMMKTDIIRAYTFSSNNDREQVLDVKMFVGIKANCSQDNDFSTSKVISGGMYARFEFTGTWEDYKIFSYDIYMFCLPSSGYMRRCGEDIEHFTYDDSINSHDEQIKLRMVYYIPVEKRI